MLNATKPETSPGVLSCVSGSHMSWAACCFYVSRWLQAAVCGLWMQRNFTIDTKTVGMWRQAKHSTLHTTLHCGCTETAAGLSDGLPYWSRSNGFPNSPVNSYHPPPAAQRETYSKNINGGTAHLFCLEWWELQCHYIKTKRIRSQLVKSRLRCNCSKVKCRPGLHIICLSWSTEAWQTVY